MIALLDKRYGGPRVTIASIHVGAPALLSALGYVPARALETCSGGVLAVVGLLLSFFGSSADALLQVESMESISIQRGECKYVKIS